MVHWASPGPASDGGPITSRGCITRAALVLGFKGCTPTSAATAALLVQHWAARAATAALLVQQHQLSCKLVSGWTTRAATAALLVHQHQLSCKRFSGWTTSVITTYLARVNGAGRMRATTVDLKDQVSNATKMLLAAAGVQSVVARTGVLPAKAHDRHEQGFVVPARSTYDLCFIDGNHDYEKLAGQCRAAMLHDIKCARRFNSRLPSFSSTFRRPCPFLVRARSRPNLSPTLRAKRPQ